MKKVCDALDYIFRRVEHLFTGHQWIYYIGVKICWLCGEEVRGDYRHYCAKGSAAWNKQVDAEGH